METQICCLKKIGSFCGKLSRKDNIVRLDNQQEVNIGRTEDAFVCIPDRMISRKHAILEKNENMQWTITDNKSLNGIFINASHLEPSKPYVLKDGDKIQLGVAPTKGKDPLFVFEFREHLKVKVATVPKTEMSPVRRKKSDSPQAGCSHVLPKKKLKLDAGDVWSPSIELEKKLKEQESLSYEKMQQAEERLAKLQEELQAKNIAQEQLELELKNKEELMKKEMREQQEKLEKQRQDYEEKLRTVFEEQIRDKEETIKKQMTEQLDELQKEKQKIEESLQKELTRKLEEKDKDLEEKLLQQKENLEKVIQTKEANQKLLESQLDDTKVENEKQKETMLRAREDVLANFTDALETELQCSICNELFVQATSLNCSHSFCALCINTWMKRKKECPNCRAKITSHVRSIVLDSYIDKMVEFLSDEMKDNRKALIASRKTTKTKAKSSPAKKVAVVGQVAAVSHTGAASGVRTRASAAMGTTNVNANQPVVIDIPAFDVNEEIVITEDTDDDDDSDISDNFNLRDSSSDWEDSDDYEEGYRGAYYGGYGHCFICRMRGHWANGCPNR